MTRERSAIVHAMFGYRTTTILQHAWYAYTQYDLVVEVVVLQ
jgi:hypothetical protein